METYERPEIVATFSVEQLAQEAAVCVIYGKTTPQV
jgi:hypothetical protein